MIDVSVVYAKETEQRLVTLNLPDQSTALQAVRASGLLGHCLELKEADLTLGIFSNVVDANTVLSQGDRVEIYRPLTMDPKAARRLRAARQLRR